MLCNAIRNVVTLLVWRLEGTQILSATCHVSKECKRQGRRGGSCNPKWLSQHASMKIRDIHGSNDGGCHRMDNTQTQT
jgi:hypothetical protein